MARLNVANIVSAQRSAFAKHGAGVGVDSVWEQYKLEATLREMLAVGAARRPRQGGPAVPSVQPLAPRSKAKTGCTSREASLEAGLCWAADSYKRRFISAVIPTNIDRSVNPG